MQLVGYKKIRGKIKLLTGLHIGGSKDEIRIGGTDNPIIRNPLDDYPYIPGSSLKGKIRFLLEWQLGKVSNNGDVHSCDDPKCPICRIFGTTNQNNTAGPGRAIFRDCFLTKESKEILNKLKEEKGLIYVEEKYENIIDRKKGTSKNLRQMERVPAGVEFEFSLDYRIFDTEDRGELDREYFKHIIEGLKLLENDALGGSGSRGYGRIKFIDLTDENGNRIEL